MRNTRWIYKTDNTDTGSKLNIDKDIINILQNRGIKTDEEIYSFINCSLDNIRKPFSLQDVEKAVERIIKAKENNENIWIYGDYDVDGITSTSLWYLALDNIGITPEYYIPLRDEGYGLNMEAMKYISEQGGNLVITVDCGISSHKEIQYANELGLDIIVTDHHEINHGNPPAFAVINPKREDNSFPFKYLAGVGTSFMVLLGLYTKLKIKDEIFKYIDLAAVGTVADIVPLIEENRIFTKFGMEKLRRSESLGLRMLIKKIFEDYDTRKFSTYDIGFIIAPIFNAAGRLEDAKRAVELLIEKDHVKCTLLINELLKNNSERKEIQEDIFSQAIEEIEKNKLYENSVIIVAKEKFHHGVIGIVASKILDRYYKPTIVMEIKKNEGVAVASCRSIEGFNMIEAIDRFGDLLERYGGHAGAAGLTVKIENIKKFSEKLIEYAKETVAEINFIKPVKIDVSIPAYKISYDFINRISALEPFGFGNPSPVFTLKSCEISDIRAIGQDKNHIMFNAKKDSIEIKNCVWFNSEDVFTEFVSFSEADIAFKLKMETFRDRYQYKMFVEDIQPVKEVYTNRRYEDIELHDTVFPIETVIYTRKKFNSSNLKLVYHNHEVDVTVNRSYLSSLDSQTAHILTQLNSRYNYNFTAVVKDVILKDQNYNVHIIIDRKYDFTSYSLKPGELFTEIKEFLIGDFSYNRIQKKVLASVFKNKKNTVVKTQAYRGINTIIQTIGLFYKNIGKKALCITDRSLPRKTANMIKISNEFKEGYDFYIWIEPYDKIENFSAPTLIFTEKNINIYPDFSMINDEISIPENIVFINEDMLMKKDNIFSNKLPLSERKHILKNIKNYEVLYCTKDILIYIN
ncbi:single-stranded-DNA-specific exonuclease RecJ [Fusobacterium sp.]|uniref:single-stranded-DNA-specific exonuclease RecJ n=1 Tax=Fusobacterium sp. TaxID=68766 RepID=UPI00396C8DFE